MRNDNLVESKMGTVTQKITFKGKKEILIASPMAELFLSHKSTGISNVTAFLKLPKLYYYVFLFLGEPLRNLLNTDFKNSILNITDKIVKGPSEKMNASKKSLIGVNIRNDEGESVLMWIETPEAYYFTGILCVEAIKKVLMGTRSGVFTPYQAFGSDFIMKFRNVEIYDKNFKPCSFIYS